jgi:hypothetical protein
MAPATAGLIFFPGLSIKFLLGNQLQTAIRESATLRSA